MSKTSGPGWFRYGLAALAGLACLGCAVLFAWKLGGLHHTIAPPTGSAEPADLFARTFDGKSKDLHQTVIVPTLDTPIPDRRSAIWCSSFQLAWNRLKNDVAGGPILLENAQPLADRLNHAEYPETDLAPETFYSAAGLVRDDIMKRIQDDMAQKFPKVAQPLLDPPQSGAVAYGYVQAGVAFANPFFENDERFEFNDSAGRLKAVGAFGIRKKDDYAYDKLRRQVAILWYHVDEKWRGDDEVSEFVLDPCKESQPLQLILARIKRQPSLAATLADVQRKITERPARVYASGLAPRDTLLIPNMNWKVEHRFVELEGADKLFRNPSLRGLNLDTAFQSIQFRMDRSGAELASEAKEYCKPSASYFHFNRPFLIIMKNRGAKQPFFVMWVDNAELLCPQ